MTFCCNSSASLLSTKHLHERITDYSIIQNVSIWALIEPAIAICCMSASTWRPLFNSLREKTTTPTGGYGFRSAGAGNQYIKSGSTIPPNQSNPFGLSRNHSGYMKSVDAKEMGGYDDSIALRSLAVGTVTMGTSGRTSEGDDDTKGILTSTTVEITRHNRRGEDNA